MLLIDRNPNAEALGDFREITAWIWCRKQRKLAGRRVTDCNDFAQKLLIRKGINRNVGNLANLDLSDVCFLNIGVDPNPLRVVNQKEPLTWRDVFAFLNKYSVNNAVDRAANRTVGTVEALAFYLGIEFVLDS